MDTLLGRDLFFTALYLAFSAFDEEIFGLVFMTSALTPFCFFFSFLEMARPHRPLSPFFIHSNTPPQAWATGNQRTKDQAWKPQRTTSLKTLTRKTSWDKILLREKEYSLYGPWCSYDLGRQWLDLHGSFFLSLDRNFHSLNPSWFDLLSYGSLYLI